VIPVVDGHHHIWRQADLPWLMGPMQPRIFGPYEPIRRDYPIEEFRADLNGLDVVKSVYVQTNWSPEAYEDEAAWVQRTADKTGWPHAIVAYADVSADDVRPQLDRLRIQLPGRPGRRERRGLQRRAVQPVDGRVRPVRGHRALLRGDQGSGQGRGVGVHRLDQKLTCSEENHLQPVDPDQRVAGAGAAP